MLFQWRPAALLVLFLGVAPAIGEAQGFKWWQSERFQRELQLTTDQISRIEEVFQSSVPDLRQRKEKLDRLEKDLSRLIDTAADEPSVIQQLNRVEEVRSELSKARTLMLLRIRRLLNPDQRVRLVALHDEWERNRKRQDRHR